MAWLVLTRFVYPVPPELTAAIHGRSLISGLAAGGAMTPAERRVGTVFLTAAALWTTRPLLNRVPGLDALTDPAIALLCAAALFLIPNGVAADRRFLLTWREAMDIPWQVLLLFGGGMSLASAMDQSGLAGWIGESLAQLGTIPPLVFLALLTTTVVLLTELASNTAATAALLPIVATVAAGTGVDLVTISAAVAMAASCAFMLPVATPPNALVFATGHVAVADMVRAGILMNVLSVVLVTAAALSLGPLLPGPARDPHLESRVGARTAAAKRPGIDLIHSPRSSHAVLAGLSDLHLISCPRRPRTYRSDDERREDEC